MRTFLNAILKFASLYFVLASITAYVDAGLALAQLQQRKSDRPMKVGTAYICSAADNQVVHRIFLPSAVFFEQWASRDEMDKPVAVYSGRWAYLSHPQYEAVNYTRVWVNAGKGWNRKDRDSEYFKLDGARLVVSFSRDRIFLTCNELPEERSMAIAKFAEELSAALDAESKAQASNESVNVERELKLAMEMRGKARTALLNANVKSPICAAMIETWTKTFAEKDQLLENTVANFKRVNQSVPSSFWRALSGDYEQIYQQVSSGRCAK